MRIWGIESGIQEIDEQIHSLGKELNGNFEFKSIALKPIWRGLSTLTGYTHDSFFEKGADQLVAPWPDVIINGHPTTASLAVLIKQRSEGKSFLVNIQPLTAPSINFDLIIAPEHENLKGANIFKTTGHLTSVKPETLDKDTYANTYKHLEAPLIFVMGGEESQTFLLNEDEIKNVAEDLAKFQEKTGGTLILSKHIDPDERLKEYLEILPNVSYLFLQKTDPLIGALSWANILVCLGDEVATISKACSTGKPVLHYKLDRTPPAGFTKLYKKLLSRGMITSTSENFEDVSYFPLRETERVATYINRLLQSKQKVNVLL